MPEYYSMGEADCQDVFLKKRVRSDLQAGPGGKSLDFWGLLADLGQGSGIVYGQAAMIDGMLDRFAGEIGSEIRAVATGGLAPGIIPFCRHRILLDSELMLRGLSLIYDMNRRER